MKKVAAVAVAFLLGCSGAASSPGGGGIGADETKSPAPAAPAETSSSTTTVADPPPDPPTPVPVEAGPDASDPPVEAGVLEASTPDAGPDVYAAPPPDASPPDASPPDASTPDAGPKPCDYPPASIDASYCFSETPIYCHDGEVPWSWCTVSTKSSAIWCCPK